MDKQHFQELQGKKIKFCLNDFIIISSSTDSIFGEKRVVQKIIFHWNQEGTEQFLHSVVIEKT